jgi:hypothetical protein
VGRLELPEWLVELLEREEAAVDHYAIAGRLASAGVGEIAYLGFPGGPDALIARGSGLDIVVDLREQDAPATAALDELVAFLQDCGALRKVHAADQDMDHVAHAARELANELEADEVGPYTQVSQVLETGIVTMYARHFTGNARLGDSWLPPAGPARDLHNRIMNLRKTVYAHADWTGSRTIVDTNAMLGGTGPPILAEQRSSLSAQELLAIAELAEQQQLRFYEASGQLKQRLGAANAPPD